MMLIRFATDESKKPIDSEVVAGAADHDGGGVADLRAAGSAVAATGSAK